MDRHALAAYHLPPEVDQKSRHGHILAHIDAVHLWKEMLVVLEWGGVDVFIVCSRCSPPGGTFDQQAEDVEALGSPLLPLLVPASIQLLQVSAPP